MKILISILSLMLLYKIVGAQDLIIKNNGKDTIRCNITEDKIKYLRFTKYNTTDTTVYQINQDQFEYYIKAPENTLVDSKPATSSQSLSNNRMPGNLQNPQNLYNYKFHLGFGLGIDYGGFGGIRFAFLPVDFFAIFAAGGYALVDFGYNFGVTLRLSSGTKVCPYASAMYGYNGVIQIKGAPKYDKIYYGPSFSIGIEFRSNKLRNYFNIELLIPVRSQDFHNDFDALKKNPLIKIENEPLPVGISFGYHFVF